MSEQPNATAIVPYIRAESGPITITVDEKAEQVAQRLTGAMAIMMRITNPAQNERAVALATEFQIFEKAVIDAHEAAKKPFWEACKKLDEAKRELLKAPGDEHLRLRRVMGTYLTLLEANTRALNNARNTELDKLERQKEAEISQAVSHEHVEAIREDYARSAATLPKHETPKPAGQKLAEDWEIEITDPITFVAKHPQLANVTPKLRELKGALKAGVTIHGIRATPKNEARVATPKPSKPIDVAAVNASQGDPNTCNATGDEAAGDELATPRTEGADGWVICEGSHQVARFTYHPKELILNVLFNSGGQYHYYQVPPEVYEAMKRAKSVGGFLNQRVKGTFGYGRVTNAQR